MNETSYEMRSLAGGGEMGSRLRDYDWASSPLGAIEKWPQSLITAVNICLNSRFPMLVWWGPDLIKIYNDAYSIILGAKHPAALGKAGREVWPEIWDIIGPMLDGVLTRGEATWSDDQLLLLERQGFPEECYFTFSYSPIRGETGEVAGVFTAVTETTQRVYGEQRLRTLRDLAARASEAKTAVDACRIAASVLAENPADLPFSLIYLLDSDSRYARLAGISGLEEGSPFCPQEIALSHEEDTQKGAAWLLTDVTRTGQARKVDDLQSVFGPAAHAQELSANSAVILPVPASGQDTPAGLLVAGVSPRRLFDDDYSGFLRLVAGHVAAAVAEARAYEEERRRAEMLAELDKAKTVFFSNVSHEFRTPLTLLLGPLEQALNDVDEPLPAGQRERLEIASRNGLRLLKLVNTLLDFSRIEAGRIEATYEPVDLAAFTAELAGIFRSTIERAGLKLVVDCPPLPEPVYVDPNMWEKIVLNLLSNAFKFTLDGQITVSLRAIAGRAVLTVCDTGVGIAANEQSHVFERFHRIYNTEARTHEGSGIGLALVQELVRLHGGTVDIESTPGTGTTFTVSLPLGSTHLPADRLQKPGDARMAAMSAHLYVEEAARWLAEDGPAPESDQSGDLHTDMLATSNSGASVTARARILLADDNADVRDYLRRLLGQRWEVEAVADGRAALASVRDRLPDLVLSDVMMPHLDGFALLKELRNDPQTKSVPVILLTARAGEEAAIEGLSMGADDYLAKPFSARELVARVSALLEMSRLRDEATRKEREHARRIQKLAEASVAINATLSLDDVLRLVTEQARQIIGAHQAVTSLASGDVGAQTIKAVSFSDRYSAWQEYDAQPTGSGIYRLVARTNRPMRLSQDELESHPQWKSFGAHAADHPPLRGWLAAPLIGRDGHNQGLIQLSDRYEGDFTEEDEAILVQLAQMASGAVDNATLYTEAQQALQMRDEFLSVASHELKTPLTALHGYAQILQKRLRVGSEWSERDGRMLEVIDEQARRLRSLMDTLLDLSRLERGRFGGDLVEVDMAALVQRVVHDLQLTLEGRNLDLLCDDGPLTVLGDELRLEQAIQNLLQNAFKYSPPESTVHVQLTRQDGSICLLVRDDGIGIPANEIASLFQPFYRASNAVKTDTTGTGMGLYVVKQIADRHGGSLAVESIEGEGSMFTLRLPARTGAE